MKDTWMASILAKGTGPHQRGGDSARRAQTITVAGLADWAAANSEFATQISAATRDKRVQNRQAEATCW